MVKSVEKCQEFCRTADNCKYFIYNKREEDCELRDDDVRQCDIVRGPPSPGYEGCETAYFHSG